MTERCKKWVCEDGIAGHTCLQPLPCPIHGIKQEVRKVSAVSEQVRKQFEADIVRDNAEFFERSEPNDNQPVKGEQGF